MRAILAMMLLASLSYAEFNYSSFMGGAGYGTVNFTHEGIPAQAIVSGQAIHAILLPTLPFGEIAPTTDANQISSALTSYYIAAGYSEKALLGLPSVHAGILSIKKNKNAGESKCRIVTGTDRTECVDFLSCQKACYSVTSFCLPVALGSGRVFINEIWKFENASRRLEAAYGQEESAYSRFSENMTRSNAESYLESLSELNKAATVASGSALYDAYSYCALPDYSLSTITNMQLIAQKYYLNASRPYFVSDEAQSVKVRTLEGFERIAALEAGEFEPVLNQTNGTGAPSENVSLPPIKRAYSSPQTIDGKQVALLFAALIGLAVIASFAISKLGRKKKL